jgi:hypothetical protein
VQPDSDHSVRAGVTLASDHESDARGSLRIILAMAGIAGAAALLGPVSIATRLAGAMTRMRLEADHARRALRQLGISEPPLAIEPLGGGRSNAVYSVRFADRTVVLKVALSEGTLLAFGARLVGPQPYARDVSATGRIGREARALAILHAAGVRVPRVIAANPEAGLLLVEHVDGVPLPATLATAGVEEGIRAYARVLRAAHDAGVVITDAHPGNALVADDGTLTLIDLEFAESRDSIAGDPPSELTDRAAFASRVAFDIAYAAQYFTGTEREAFLAVFDNARVPAAIAKLQSFAPMFALERRRQRKHRIAVVAQPAIARAV